MWFKYIVRPRKQVKGTAPGIGKPQTQVDGLLEFTMKEMSYFPLLHFLGGKMHVLAYWHSLLLFAKVVFSLIYSVFIRTLSTSDDVEDRENEKGRLEEAYEKCDRDLDELIVQHYTELTTAIRTYQSITERITNSRNKIKQVGLLLVWWMWHF